MSNILRTLMMGGIDGVITVFNIISGIEGSKLNYKYIFIIGIATLIGDAISMGTGEYISVKAENELKNINNNSIPEKKGIIMFLSFIAFGMIPLILYFLMAKINFKRKYINSYISTIIALFIIGIVKSRYTKEKWYKSGANISLYGAAASFISFNISRLISTHSL